MARNPAVAGQFYDADPAHLRADVESYCVGARSPARALGLLCPHAGYVFSGGVAGKTFASVQVPDTVLLLTPSHHYAQPALALWTDGPWRTPLGEVQVHDDLTRALALLPGVTEDDRPHLPEHSGEVVLPFIQHRNPDARIAVICVTASAGLDALLEFGAALPEVLSEADAEDALVVASSDMSHENGAPALEIVSAHDRLAIEQMELAAPEGLFATCMDNEVTMCGVLPATAMIASCRARGGSRGELIARATSADSPYGRGTYVVGYAGVTFA